MKVKSESEVAHRLRLFVTPWTTAYQAPLSMGFSRQEYWSGVPLPSPFPPVLIQNVKVAQLCPTLRDPMDYSLPGSSIHWIFQARVLEWVAIAFSLRSLSHLNSDTVSFSKALT